MRIRKGFLCLILAALLLGGCQKEEVQQEGYQIYYMDKNENTLATETYLPESGISDDLVDELIGKWVANPQSQKMTSAKPKNVSMISYEMEKSCLIVNFSASYKEMSNVEEMILRYSLVKTMLQAPQVKSVRITVSGEALTDAKGQEIGAMTDKSFVDSEKVGVDGFEEMDYVFYFADENGTLREETQTIHYSTSSEKIQVVLKNLIAGTQKSNLLSVISEDTKVLSARIENGVCTVNFSEEFNQPMEGVMPDTSIYAVVNTLCGLNGVTSVKINIAGDTESYYQDTIDLSVPLERREELVNTGVQDTQKVGVDYLMKKVSEDDQEEDLQEEQEDEQDNE
ncbi:MAG: GerMN domain-containing protein [Lachnospiraceae bacterium]|nr:GerMN domain-containing protein [Robinsoniella sp.]MDY3766510.1 GerMN domain-containing protein [Lachnospiraceae bacterium]